ncbi:MAG: M20 family metallopeptidase [Myxococcota bacterium]
MGNDRRKPRPAGRASESGARGSSRRSAGADAKGEAEAGPDREALAALLTEARELQPRMVALRRAIHAEPELGFENPRTREKLIAQLEGLGLDLSLHERTTGVVAVLRGEANELGAGARAHRQRGANGTRATRRVLLRGDTDALPMPEETGLAYRSKIEGRMHACGHDAHVAMLVGAAHLLARRRGELAGEVVFMFQPGEEGFGGAEVMLEEGLPEVDGAFALHVAPPLPTGMVGTKPGALMAAFDDFEIEVHGRGGHASMPQDCIDPVPIACQIVSALQAFVAREIPVTDPGVLSVTQIHGGTANNVIADSVRLQGTMRALSARTRDALAAGLRRVAEGIARAQGGEASVRILPGYPVAANDPGFEAFARGVAGELLGAGAVLPLPSAVMGAEDFAYVLERVPGAMMLLGVRPPGAQEAAPCHSTRMQLDEEAMPLGAALHAAIATRFLAGAGC